MANTNTKTQITDTGGVLGPEYLYHHPQEWVEKTGFLLKLKAIALAVFFTLGIGYVVMGIAFSLRMPYTVDWVKFLLVIITTMTVVHAYYRSAFGPQRSVMYSISSIIVSSMVLTGAFSYSGIIQSSSDIYGHLWTLSWITFICWMIQYLFVLRVQKDT